MIRGRFLIFVAAMLCAAAAPLPAQEDAESKPAAAKPDRPGLFRSAQAHLITYTGDIEAARDVRSIVDELAAAANAGGKCIVLQLTGDRVREDLLVQAARAVRDAPVRPIVFLSDATDRRVGTGQLIIALHGARCIIASGMTVIGNSPGELARYMPDDVEEDTVHQDGLALLEPLLEPRGLPLGLAQALLRPAEPTWLVASAQTPSGAKWELRHAEPGALDGRAFRFITVSAHNAPNLRLAADDALAARLADANTNAIASIFSDAGFGRGRRVDRKISSGLTDARSRVLHSLDQAEAASRDADRALDAPRDRDSVVRSKDYREAAAAARPSLTKAEEHLVAVDAVLAEYPEVLRTVPPGTAELDRQARAFMPIWRRRVDGDRRQIESLRNRCLEYESR